MYVEIIPRLRLIPSLGIFDYKSSIPVKRGQMVLVPFRTKKVFGVVWKIKKQPSYPHLKNIQGVTNIVLNENQLFMLQWIFKKHKISPSIALKIIFPDIPYAQAHPLE